MDLAIKMLEKTKKGFATVMFDKVVIRIGDRYSVGETASIRHAELTIEEAAKVLCAR